MQVTEPRTILVKGQPVTLTAATVQACRQWFADNAQACIDEAVSGATYVNNLESYVAWREQSKVDALDGLFDHSMTFLQRAYFIQSGECLALLP